MTTNPVFTVFTPTYNREATLGGVYASLQAQTFRNFEWLIVDDGSEDGTGRLVEGWKAQADFPVRYFWQPNGGKHRAFNRGVREARGELFLTLDSDDCCVPGALERFRLHWLAIPAGQRSSCSAVTALCCDLEGRIVGSGLPRAFLDADSLSIRYVHGVTGEMWGFQRTDILRQLPFPEFPGERFVPESLVWNRISLQYFTRYVNEPLRIYRQRDDGLSSRSVRLRVMSPLGTRLYYQELLDHPGLPRKGQLHASANLLRFALHTGKPHEAFRLLRRKLWGWMGIPAGLLLWGLDCCKR